MSQYSEYALSLNPIGHWKLDEEVGTLAVDSTGNSNGTYTNPSLLGGESLIVSDPESLSATFNGDGNYINTGNTSIFDNMSFSVMIKMDQTTIDNSSNKFIISCQHSNNYHSSMNMYIVGGNLIISISKASGQGSARNITVALTEGIHHIYGGFDHLNLTTGDIWLYIDGVEILIPISELGTPADGYGGNLIIGRHSQNYNNHYYDGLIAEVSYYDKRLTDQEITQLYDLSIISVSNYINKISSLNPDIYYTLNDINGTVAINSFGDDGTYNGTPIFSNEGLLDNDVDDISVDFNTASTISLATPLSLTDKFTIGFLFKLNATGTGAWNCLVSESSSTMGIYINNQKLNFWNLGGELDYIFNVDESYHITIIKDADRYTIYINGILYRMDSIGSLFNVTYIAGSSVLGEMFDGALDHVFISNDIISEATAIELYYIATYNSLYTKEIMLLDPIAYWRLNELSGVVAVDEIGNNPATYTNSPTLGVDGLIEDNISKSVDFTPIDSYLITDSQSSGLSLSDISIVTIIQVSEYPASRTNIVSFSELGIGSTLRDKSIEINSDGTISFYTFDDFQKRTTSSPIELNKPVHIVGSVDATNNSLYIDGVLVDQVDSSGSTTYDSYIVIAGDIGSGDGQSTYFNGIIDDVAIYNYALSDDDVNSIYIALLSNYNKYINSLNPIAYWRLGEADGETVAIDETGTYNGTYVNSPTLGDDGLINGDLNTAVLFDGVDDRLDISPYVTIDDDYTFSVLIKPISGDLGCIAILNITTGLRLYKYQEQLQTYVPSIGWMPTGVPLELGQIYHIVVRVDYLLNYYEIFVNGSSVYTRTHPNVIGCEFAKMGTTDGLVQYFNGVIDEASIFDKLLDDTQISNLYKLSSNEIKYLGTIRAYYKLDELTGSNIFRDSVNSYDSIEIFNTPNFERPALYQDGGTSTHFPNNCYTQIPKQDFLQGLICSFQYEDFILYTSLFSQYIDTSNRMFIGNNNNQLGVYYGNLGWVITADETIIYGHSYQVALQYNSIDKRSYLWLDGVKQSQSSELNLFINNSIYTEIASRGVNTTETEKTIDNLILYNELSDEEIIDQYYLSNGLTDIPYRAKVGENVNYDLTINDSIDIETYIKSLNPLIYPNFDYYNLYDKMGNADLTVYNSNQSYFNNKSVTKDDYFSTYQSDYNRYIRLNDSNNLSFHLQTFSVSFFLKVKSIEENKWSYITGISDSSWNNGWRIMGNETTQDMEFSITDHLTPLATIPRANYDDGQWHYYCFTYDGIESKAYLDGVLIDTVAETTVINYTSVGMYYIGAWSSSYETRGAFDHHFLINKILREDQILDILNYSKYKKTEYVKSYPALIDTLNPVAYWQMNDYDEDETCADSKNLYNGTYIGDPIKKSKNLTHDFINHSVLFDNTQYVQIPTDGNIIVNGTPFTISLIFERTVGADSHIINLPYNNGANKFTIMNVDPNYSQYGSICIGDGDLVKGKIEVGQLEDNKKYHLTLVYDGNDPTLLTSYQLYLNGVNEPLVSVSAGISNGAGTDILINKRNTTSVNGLNGYIDHVALFDTALTQENNDDLYKLFNIGTLTNYTIRDKIKYLEPVRLYLMDSSSNNINCIDEINNETGNYINSPIIGDNIPYYLPLEHSTHFNGIDQKATIPVVTLNQDFTIMMFIRRSSDVDAILIQGTGVSLGIKGDYLNVEYTGDNLSSTTLDKYTKYHIAISSSGGAGNMFINGVNVGTFTSIPNFDPTDIGSTTYKGLINYVAMYNYVIDPTDILDISNEALIIKEKLGYSPNYLSKNSPIHYWDYQSTISDNDIIQNYNTKYYDNIEFNDKSLIPRLDPNNKSIWASTQKIQKIKNSNVINLYTPFTFIWNDDLITGNRNGSFYLANATHSASGITGNGFGIYCYVYFKLAIRTDDGILRVRAKSSYPPNTLSSVIIKYDGSGDANGVRIWLDSVEDDVVVESNTLIGKDEYETASDVLHFNTYKGISNKALYDVELSDEVILNQIIYDQFNQINNPFIEFKDGSQSSDFLVRIDPQNIPGYIKTKSVSLNLHSVSNGDIYSAEYKNIKLEGMTKINGTGTKCKVYIFDSEMNFIDSFLSEEDGSFLTRNVYLDGSYNIIVKSFTGECPEISGIVQPTSDSD